MRITRVITKEVIQSLGSNSSFDISRPTMGQPTTITMSIELGCVRILNTLIPISNIREIVFEPTSIKEDTEVTEKPSKKAKTV
jgi:hypothetical protein